MAADIPTLLADAWSALRHAGVTCAVIGGCARNAYAEVRATKDVDLVVEADPAVYRAAVEALASRGFVRAAVVGARDGEVPDLELFRDPAGRRIDLLFAHTEFERSALSRRTPREPYAGVTVSVVSPEDLIVYKIIAGRPQDRLDVHALLDALTAERTIDWTYSSTGVTSGKRAKPWSACGRSGPERETQRRGLCRVQSTRGVNS